MLVRPVPMRSGSENGTLIWAHLAPFHSSAREPGLALSPEPMVTDPTAMQNDLLVHLSADMTSWQPSGSESQVMLSGSRCQALPFQLAAPFVLTTMQNDLREQETCSPLGEPRIGCQRAPSQIAAPFPTAMQNDALTHDTELMLPVGIATTCQACPFHFSANGLAVCDGSEYEPTVMQKESPTQDTAVIAALATGVVPKPTSGTATAPKARVPHELPATRSATASSTATLAATNRAARDIVIISSSISLIDNCE